MKKLILSLSAFALCLAVNAQSTFTENWPNGNKKIEGKMLGEAKIESSDSKETRATKMNNVTKDGKWNTWFENGTMRSEENYSSGDMVGVWKVWYDNSQVESELNFTTGKATYYFKNGSINSTGTIANGMVHKGTWTGYYENGQKNYEGSYTAEGQKDGVWKWWDDKGVETNEQTFKNGTLLTTKNLKE